MIPGTKFQDWRDCFLVNVKFRLKTKVRDFYTILIHLTFSSDFWDKLGVKFRGMVRAGMLQYQQ